MPLLTAMPDSTRDPFHAARALFLCLSTLCAGTVAWAHDVPQAGQAPSSASVQRWTLNGSGERTLLGFTVYVAALYLPEPMRDAARVLDGRTPRRLQVTLLHDTTTEQNLDALRDGLADNNSEAELEAIKGEVDLLFALIRQVHAVPAGTIIQLDFQPAAGTVLSIGGRMLGLIPGERFNRAVMKIWLGERPIQHSLKRALLGISRPVM